jgi:hypothetical protein
MFVKILEELLRVEWILKEYKTKVLVTLSMFCSFFQSFLCANKKFKSSQEF